MPNSDSPRTRPRLERIPGRPTVSCLRRLQLLVVPIPTSIVPPILLLVQHTLALRRVLHSTPMRRHTHTRRLLDHRASIGVVPRMTLVVIPQVHVLPRRRCVGQRPPGPRRTLLRVSRGSLLSAEVTRAVLWYRRDRGRQPPMLFWVVVLLLRHAKLRFGHRVLVSWLVLPDTKRLSEAHAALIRVLAVRRRLDT